MSPGCVATIRRHLEPFVERKLARLFDHAERNIVADDLAGRAGEGTRGKARAATEIDRPAKLLLTLR